MVQSISTSLELDILKAEVAIRYVFSGATTILAWDILTHFSDEIELLFLPRCFRPPTIVYFVSRYTMLTYLILQYFYFAENTESQCTMPKVAVTFTVISYIAIVTTLLQFLIRVKAIFSDIRFAQWFFTFLWFLAAGGTSLLILGVSSSGICSSDYSFYVPVISILVHDSCVFVAISYRIYEISMAFPKRSSPESSTHANQFKMLLVETLWGRNLPSLSRALLRNGQIYYLISLICSISTLWLMLDTSLLPPERLLLAPMHAVVINVTAGHVFRETRLGRMREHELLPFYQPESQACNGVSTPMVSTQPQETEEIA